MIYMALGEAPTLAGCYVWRSALATQRCHGAIDSHSRVNSGQFLLAGLEEVYCHRGGIWRPLHWSRVGCCWDVLPAKTSRSSVEALQW